MPLMIVGVWRFSLQHCIYRHGLILLAYTSKKIYFCDDVDDNDDDDDRRMLQS